jgi:hypothetical protein
MACPNFEDLLNGKCGDHVLNCKDCRALMEACAEVDSVFDAAFSGIAAPSGVTAAVRSRIDGASMQRRPSPIPEFLDLIGWAAVLAAAAVCLPRFASFISAIFAGLS